MNAAKYFTQKYWARKYFATRPAGGAFVWIGSGAFELSGAAQFSYTPVSIYEYVGSGFIQFVGEADTEFDAATIYQWIGDGSFELSGAASYTFFHYATEFVYLGSGAFWLDGAAVVRIVAPVRWPFVADERGYQFDKQKQFVFVAAEHGAPDKAEIVFSAERAFVFEAVKPLQFSAVEREFSFEAGVDRSLFYADEYEEPGSYQTIPFVAERRFDFDDSARPGAV